MFLQYRIELHLQQYRRSDTKPLHLPPRKSVLLHILGKAQQQLLKGQNLTAQAQDRAKTLVRPAGVFLTGVVLGSAAGVAASPYLTWRIAPFTLAVIAGIRSQWSP